MAPSFDSQQSESTALPTKQEGSLPRLFNVDLPALKQTGKPLPEQDDTSTVHRLLDIASGTGEWAINAAQVSPHLQVVGIEHDTQHIENTRKAAQTRKVNNITFIAMDPFGPLNFPEDSFDLVNARFLMGLLPAAAWLHVLREFTRVARSGGVIRLTETDLPITSGPAFEKLNALISQVYSHTKRSFSPEGRLLSVTPVLKRLLQDAGCQSVQQKIFVTNFSAGMQTHTEVCQDIARTYQLVLPFLINIGVTTQQEGEQLYQQMLSEMQENDFCGTALYLTVWGTKPE